MGGPNQGAIAAKGDHEVRMAQFIGGNRGHIENRGGIAIRPNLYSTRNKAVEGLFGSFDGISPKEIDDCVNAHLAGF